jgi:Zn ribbon nucleic-acid-binding protein
MLKRSKKRGLSMSGFSDSAICPKCKNNMDTYSDYKPHDYVSGQCLECGFAYETVEYRVGLKTLNQLRVDSELPKLSRKEFKMNKEVKKILLGFLLAFTLCGCDVVFAQPDEWAIKAILGEGEDQGIEGMTALGEAIRNRGTLNGVYGFKAVVVKNGKYYRKTKKGLRQISDYVVKNAKQAWNDSENTDYVRGADHWENIKEFGVPYWANTKVKTATIKDHAFYK